MSYEMRGVLAYYGKIQQHTDTFKTQDFVLETGGAYPQKIKFQLKNDRCGIFKKIPLGSELEVVFDIQGRAHTKDGDTKYYNNLSAWKITPLKLGTVRPVAPNGGMSDDLPF